MARFMLSRSCLLLTVLALAPVASASERPIRSFTTADGLSDNRIHRMLVDSRGLLWVSTAGGLSRFDGTSFQSFGIAQGLPFHAINDLLEMPDGDFWLGSNGGGVIHFPLSAGHRSDAFVVGGEPMSNRVNRLVRARDGTIWLGTDGGLFRMRIGADGKPAFSPAALRLASHPEATIQVWSLAEDGEGTIWAGTRFGLVRLLADGRTIWYRIRTALEADHALALLYTPENGLLWIGHEFGLAILKPPRAPSIQGDHAPERAQEDLSIARSAGSGHRDLVSAAIALPGDPDESLYFDAGKPGSPLKVGDLVRSGAGGIYVIANGVVFEFSEGRFTAIEDARLRPSQLAAGGEDPAGNLWVGTQAGLLRMARHGFMTFAEADGLGRIVARVFVSRDGDPIAVSEDWRISRFDGERFHTVRANVPAAARRTGWQAAGQTVIQDRRGDWWFATHVGLVRFEHASRIEDLATMVPRLYSSRDGLAQDDIWRVFEDSRGDIWTAGFVPGREVLTRWDRKSGQFRRYSDADGLQPFNTATGFYEDPRGIVWISFRDGGLARYEGDRFRMLSEADGFPAGGIGHLFADHAGRLYCASASKGVFRIDDLNAERVRPVVIATPDKLTSRVAEDAFGSIYLVTPQGIMRIDDTAAATPPPIAALYTGNAGLVSGEILDVSRDRQGRLWFSAARGVSYYLPAGREEAAAPRVRLTGLRIAGIARPISAAGEEGVAGLELYPGQSQLEIDYFGISFASEESLAFEYRLRGADEAWSPPSRLRSVLFSNLAPGRYEFEVRAVSSTGARSPQPARAAFRVVPPIWRRWWFLSLIGLTTLGSFAAFERYRAAHAREIARARNERLAELERVRQRIAADLHDEIGSSLTQISLLSEVARRHESAVVPELGRSLSTIAASSRELVDAMADIVWAINPSKDHLSDVTQRMRRLAADTFTACDIEFQLKLPPAENEITLGANMRREVFLIFKEAVNNIVKHAECSEVVIQLTVQGGLLRLELHDNGIGFDPSQQTEGHGLASLHSRARALGGTLTVDSTPGAGTAIALSVPLPT